MRNLHALWIIALLVVPAEAAPPRQAPPVRHFPNKAAGPCQIPNCPCGCQEGGVCKCDEEYRQFLAWRKMKNERANKYAADGWEYNATEGYYYKYPTATAPVQPQPSASYQPFAQPQPAPQSHYAPSFGVGGFGGGGSCASGS